MVRSKLAVDVTRLKIFYKKIYFSIYLVFISLNLNLYSRRDKTKNILQENLF